MARIATLLFGASLPWAYGTARYRLDRLEEGQAQLTEGVRYLTSFLRDRVKGR